MTPSLLHPGEAVYMRVAPMAPSANVRDGIGERVEAAVTATADVRGENVSVGGTNAILT